MDAQILAISTDELSQAEHAVKGLELQHPVLYDTESALVKEYQVIDLLHDGGAAPAVFLLDKNGSVRWEYIGRSKSDRPSNSEEFLPGTFGVPGVSPVSVC